MTTTEKAAVNGSAISRTASGDGLVKLRREEIKALISLVCEAAFQTQHLTSEMHSLINGTDSPLHSVRLCDMADEAEECLRTTGEYLRMLGDCLSGHREPPL